MLSLRRAYFLALILLLTAGLQAKQPTEYSISRQLDKLQSLSTADSSAVALQIATDIRTLPPGMEKVKLADALSEMVTGGNPSPQLLQAVATTLSQALSEHPIPEKKDQPAAPYMNLARYVRYENVTVDLKASSLDHAEKILADNDASLDHVDFTLKDMHGKKVTLSQLRGKIVLVNFWATWCLPCRVEMPALDAIYKRLQSQGVEVLSITKENGFQVSLYLTQTSYHPPILLDAGGKVFKDFHITTIPKTFAFDREGKLAAQSMNQCSLNQFLAMIRKADLQN
ncbi:MAG TPA: TlpA disulfide reductase family protein [Acidobacteriaceae bacterium]|nr:TlpA disulfide reductase family protein [Acidobacteriaceae bacterium]